MTENRLKDGEVANYYHKKIITQTVTQSKERIFNDFIAIQVTSKTQLDLEALKKVNEEGLPKII